jgi:thiosulfate reductase cytochrome b subunit
MFHLSCVCLDDAPANGLVVPARRTAGAGMRVQVLLPCPIDAYLYSWICMLPPYSVHLSFVLKVFSFVCLCTSLVFMSVHFSCVWLYVCFCLCELAWTCVSYRYRDFLSL